MSVKVGSLSYRVLRKTFGAKMEDVAGDWGEDCTARSFTICSPHQILLGCLNQRTYEEQNMQTGFWLWNGTARGHLEERRVAGRATSKFHTEDQQHHTNFSRPGFVHPCVETSQWTASSLCYTTYSIYIYVLCSSCTGSHWTNAYDPHKCCITHFKTQAMARKISEPTDCPSVSISGWTYPLPFLSSNFVFNDKSLLKRSYLRYIFRTRLQWFAVSPCL